MMQIIFSFTFEKYMFHYLLIERGNEIDGFPITFQEEVIDSKKRKRRKF